VFYWQEIVEKDHKGFRVGFRFIKVQRSGSIDFRMHKVYLAENSYGRSPIGHVPIALT
jgi:hypothetical protein